MTTTAPAVLHEGLNVTLRVRPDEPFFLTGVGPPLEIEIQNPGDGARTGRLLLRMIYETPTLTRVSHLVDFQVGAKESVRLPLEGSDFLWMAGTVVWELVAVGSPESCAGLPAEQLEKRAKGMLMLCSYRVVDRAEFESFSKSEMERMTRERRNFWILLAVAIVSALGIFATLFVLVAR